MERRKNNNQEEEWLRGMNDKVDFRRELRHIARRFKTLGEGKKFALAELKMNIKELKITKRAEIGRNRRKERPKARFINQFQIILHVFLLSSKKSR